MHCREALEQLEAARPGDEGLEPELAEANSHLADCDGCQSEYRQRQRQDARISDVMCDVPVPPGLKAGILAALLEDSVETAALSEPAEELASKSFDRSRFSRRRWFAAAIGVAAVCTLFGVLFWKKEPVVEQRLTLADLRSDTTLDLTQLDNFDGAFQAELPAGVWRSSRIHFEKQPKGDFRDSNGGPHRVALYGFQVRHRGQKFDGVMLVMQRQELDDPPQEQQFTHDDGAKNYARRSNGTFHAIAWSKGDRVYVCFVRVGDGSLDALTNALSRTPV